MAWDDAAARQFAGGLANAYFMGADPRGYQNARLQDEEMALRREQNARAIAAESRAQAVHDALMRKTGLVEGLTDELINASRGAGLPVPEGQMGGDGFGPPTPAGLKTPQLSPQALTDMRLRLAAAHGNTNEVGDISKEIEKRQFDAGLAKHMAEWRKLPLEQKLEVPWVKAQFNANINVPGELAITKDGKLVLTNYNGKGETKPIDPDLLDRAAAAYFMEQAGYGSQSVEAAAKVGADRHTRVRQGVSDNNDAISKYLAAQNDAARTGIAARESNARIAALPKEVPPEILKELQGIEEQFINSTNPAEKAALRQRYELVSSRARLAIGKPGGLPPARNAPEKVEITNADGSKTALMVDPMSKQPLFMFGNDGRAVPAAPNPFASKEAGAMLFKQGVRQGVEEDPATGALRYVYADAENPGVRYDSPDEVVAARERRKAAVRERGMATPGTTRPAAPSVTPGFDQRRQTVLAEDAAKRAQLAAAQRAQAEAARRAALEQRPDLQQLGGLRHFR